MKIAVIGSGIAGMTAAYYLSRQHEVSLFEADRRLGGHTATIDVEEGDRQIAVDTGFIVFNDWTYPGFIALMDELQVSSRPTEMSFSVSDRVSGLEYAGSNLNTLFAQRRNLFSPAHLQMLKDILRFNQQVENHLTEFLPGVNPTLGEYLERFNYSQRFIDYYIVPMGAAIWSARQSDMLQMPLQFFVRFFRNHGLLNIKNRPQWRVIEGGSKNYIDPLTRPYRDRIRLNAPVLAVDRNITGSYVTVTTPQGSETFDHLVFACHSNQVLDCLQDASPLEQEILGAIPYSRNEVVLHTDASVLPSSRRCWSSWNVELGADNEIPRLSYNMNILQGIESSKTYCVTLNHTDAINPDSILGIYHYEHPIFSTAGVAAQERWSQINGKRNTWFCGAYWRNGFHEDGVWSAQRVCENLNFLSRDGAQRAA
ncbi:MAG: FAD-dependent oxidoreductase [Gammaproteobacteria bacterium]|nr:FAD-dependent oxidoreductase [Gammaproteobacteria bacterium]|tara:strand:- start:275 stop:1549 length:1275 start_codon:yes stop_codon:yes gene_type:complete